MGVDGFFYELKGAASASDIAAAAELDQPARAQSVIVTDLAPPSSAGPGDLSYCTSDDPDAIIATSAGLVFVPSGKNTTRRGVRGLAADDPRLAFALASPLLARERSFDPDAPHIHPDARIEVGVHISPGALIGPNARIGTASHIGPGAMIGPGVSVGRATRIGAHASIRCAMIGDEVVIHSGVIVGDQGSGAVTGKDGRIFAVPHWGRVVVQDRVDIGSGSIVHKGILGDTVIGLGTQIGAGCRIAGNCKLFCDAILLPEVTMAQAVIVRDRARIGARAYLCAHVEIGSDSDVEAFCAVTGDIPALTAKKRSRHAGKRPHAH